MSDFWQQASLAQVPEPPKNTYESLPDKVTVICKTTTSADKDIVQPKLREVNRKDGSGSFYTLKVPMQVIGGDAKIKPSHIGKGYFFPEFNIEKPTVEQLEARIASSEAAGYESTVNRLKGQLKSLDAFPVAPELYNFLLDSLVPEGPTTQARWQEAAAILSRKSESVGFTVDGVPAESFKGNTQYLIAAAFHAMLMDNSYTVIGGTYTPRQKPGSDYVPTQTVGSFGSYTEAESKRRKVKLIEAEAKDDF